MMNQMRNASLIEFAISQKDAKKQNEQKKQINESNCGKSYRTAIAPSSRMQDEIKKIE